MRVAVIILGSVVASLVGGGLGLALGVWWSSGQDSIFPVPQLLGLIGGLIAGLPLFLVGDFLWRHRARTTRTRSASDGVPDNRRC